jgi:hypothetical protein
MRGRAPSLLELSDRPESYEDVGRLCTWDDLFPITLLPRSRFERVLSHAISGRRVLMGGAWHRPVGMKGWTHVVFRRERDGARRVRSLDSMLAHLDAWDRTADRRVADRRAKRAAPRDVERRITERRAEPADTQERRRESDQEIMPERISSLADMPTPKQTSPEVRSRPATEAPLIIITRNS